MKNICPILYRHSLLKNINKSYSTASITSDIPEIKRLCKSSYQNIIDFCKTDEGNKAFWEAIANNRVLWRKKFNKVSEVDFSRGLNRWFIGGKLNASENCLDRHVAKNPERIALIWEKDEPGQEEKITYKQLLQLTCQIANILRAQNVKKHDVVVIYMPNTPMVVATMLACVRIGAAHSVIFAGFSPQAIATRIMDAKANVIVTSDQAVRGGKVIQLKSIIDNAIDLCPEGSIQSVLVQRRTGADVSMKSRDICLDKMLPQTSKECDAETMDAEDMLYLLYTSGSTGNPKGIVHSTAGYLLYAGFTHQQCFNYSADRGDIFGCVADVGWVTGHSYIVYGPLFNGGTSLVFESTPTYPDAGRYWEMVERLRLTHIYLAPTALRLLFKFGDEFVKKYDRSSLKVLGSVGEPLNTEAWEWYHRVIGEDRCDIVDTWWQTETGGIVMSPRPSGVGDIILPGMPMRPLPGIEPVLFDLETNKLLPNSEQEEAYGALAMARGWPGLAKTLHGDHQRFIETYFSKCPGYYLSGDGCHRFLNNIYQITGRVDDVINTTGHRIGTAEMENIIDEHHHVAETAVIGYPHDVKGEAIYAFVTLKNEALFLLEPANITKRIEFIDQLKLLLRQQIAAYAIPDAILVVSSLPKTRSGKIMRRILRKIANNSFDDLGDISTLSNPEIVPELIKQHKALFKLQ